MTLPRRAEPVKFTETGEALERLRRLSTMVSELDADRSWAVVITPRADGQWALMHRATPGGFLRQRGVWPACNWRSIVSWARFVSFHLPNAAVLVAARTGAETFEEADRGA